MVISFTSETKQYVPRFSINTYKKHGNSFGIELPELNNEEQFKVAYWPTQIDLTAMVDNILEIYKLNQGLMIGTLQMDLIKL